MPIGAAHRTDDNGRTISSNEGFILNSKWTFVTGTTGATGAHTLFNVTGDVLVNVFGICKTDLTGTATFEVGISGATAGIIDQVANATTIDANESIMHTDQQTSSPTVRFAYSGFAPLPEQDIILTIASTAITAGVIDFYCLWRPLSTDGLVAVTTPA